MLTKEKLTSLAKRNLLVKRREKGTVLKTVLGPLTKNWTGSRLFFLLKFHPCCCFCPQQTHWLYQKNLCMHREKSETTSSMESVQLKFVSLNKAQKSFYVRAPNTFKVEERARKHWNVNIRLCFCLHWLNAGSWAWEKSQIKPWSNFNQLHTVQREDKNLNICSSHSSSKYVQRTNKENILGPDFALTSTE